MQWVKEWVSRIGPKRIAVAIVVIVAGAAFLLVLNSISTYFLARSYAEELADAFGLNPHLTRAFILISFIVVSYLGFLVTSFSKTRRKIGLFGLAGLFIAHSVGLWAATKDNAFDRKGLANKCYIVARDSITYGDRPGVDPKTGLECRAVTAEIVERLQRYQAGQRPKRITSTSYEFFNSTTGNPVSWFQTAGDGRIELFDLMGFHPDTGVALSPVTREMVEKWKIQQSKRMPRKIEVGPTYQFFDALSGSPRVWFKVVENDVHEFYDSDGFDASSGAPLKAVTRENVAEIIARLKEWETKDRCYVLLQNTVKYSRKPGVDKETGKPCRAYTDQQRQYLEEYAKGKRPSLVTDKTPTLFDPRSGDPIVWFWRNGQDNRIELYDLMGFHPRSGVELLPITREVADEYYRQAPESNKLPEKVDPMTYSCFNPTSGESRCWYWTDGKGTHEFYDAPGFHPRKGDPLEKVTKQLVEKLEEDAQRRKRQIEQEQIQARKEQQEKELQARKDADAEERRRLERRQKSSQLVQDCDAQAANPNDRNRVGHGVPFDQLKASARQAAMACAEAAKENPDELRLQYQFARAVSFIDPNKARQVLQVLVSKQYPAAFDNLGDLLLDVNDVPGAVRLYRRGAALGDPDAMTSLANMISEGKAAPSDASETTEALYQRACSAGHQQACSRLKSIGDKMRQRQMEEEGLRVFLGILQGVKR